MKPKTSSVRQAGFTLPEILAVVVLIGILMTTIVTGFGNAEEELAMASSKDMLLNDIPSGLISYRAVNGDLTGLTKADLTGDGISGDGPFGDAWTLGTAQARTVSVTWSLSSASDPDTFGADLGTSLNNAQGSAITSTSYDADSDALTVSYRIP